RSAGPLPARAFQSVGFTPETWMRTRTSPGPGCGSWRSPRVRTPESPAREYVTAFMAPANHARRRRASVSAGRAGAGADRRSAHRREHRSQFGQRERITGVAVGRAPREDDAGDIPLGVEQ